ncbi:MAG: hypothetical protein HQ567_20040 [Candidatus Nealsonbacteria bacterium]|nr:hypothetical protein [Candidatus Nealsonbacteria bacterium]
MNRIDPDQMDDAQIDPHEIDDARFDLLADDELTEAERRQLLGGLDDEPGGWRRCALALLESQQWKRQCGAIAREAGPEAPDKRPPGRRRQGPGGKTLAAMAACFLVALFLGLVIRDLSHRAGSEGTSPAQVADNDPNSPERGRRPESMPQRDLPQPDEPPTQFAGGDDSIAVPVGRVDDLDKWLQSLPAALPADVQRSLEQTGYRVHQTRELVPMGIEDGRQLVVPVDRVNIRYVGNPPL